MEPDGPDNEAMGQPGKKKPTALAKHRAEMKRLRAQIRRSNAEAWAWEAMYAMLARVIERAADALARGEDV